MSLTRFRAQIAALLAVLLAVWPAAASAHTRFFCRMMDRVVDSCCCRSDAALAQGAREPEAGMPDCCERLKQGALPNADARRDMVKSLSSPSLVVASDLRVPPGVAAEVLPLSLEHRSRVGARGPPLFLENCALLI